MIIIILLIFELKKAKNAANSSFTEFERNYLQTELVDEFQARPITQATMPHVIEQISSVSNQHQGVMKTATAITSVTNETRQQQQNPPQFTNVIKNLNRAFKSRLESINKSTVTDLKSTTKTV